MSAQQRFTEALLANDEPLPRGLAAWNGSDPSVRFAVYRNNVVVSLVDALADTFPVSLQLVGESFFRAMARLFVRASPPRSPVLAFYGEGFPTFIEHFPPAATVPYLADVARLEMARLQSMHALDATPIAPSALGKALENPGGLADLRLRPHPSLRILPSRYPVVSLWAAHHGSADIARIDTTVPETALVIRPHLEVQVLAIDSGVAGFIDRLLGGASLGAAYEQAIGACPHFDLAEALALLVHTNAIAAVGGGRSPS